MANWSGDFDCSVCHRKRLIAAEFSKKMIEKKKSDASALLKCRACVEAAAKAEQSASKTTVDDGSVYKCAACGKELGASSFTKPQLKKGSGKARCVGCVAASQTDRTASDAKKMADIADAKKKLALAIKSGTAADQLSASSRLSALEAEVVAGVKPRAPRPRPRGGK